MRFVDITPHSAELIFQGKKPFVMTDIVDDDLKSVEQSDAGFNIVFFRNSDTRKVIGQAKVIACYQLMYTDISFSQNQNLLAERYRFAKEVYLRWCRENHIRPNMNEGWFKSKKFRKFFDEAGFQPIYDYALMFVDEVDFAIPLEYEWFIKIAESAKETFLSYTKELKQFRNEPYDSEDALEEFHSARNNNFCTFDDLISDDEYIGFLIMGVPPNCNPNCHRYIQDIYIKPQYRRKGYGEYLIKNYCRLVKGDYCLFIIDDNLPAKAFWEHIASELGTQLTVLNDEYNDVPKCTQYTFSVVNK